MDYQEEKFHKLKYPGALEEIAAKLSLSARPKVLGEKVSRIYKLGV